VSQFPCRDCNTMPWTTIAARLRTVLPCVPCGREAFVAKKAILEDRDFNNPDYTSVFWRLMARSEVWVAAAFSTTKYIATVSRRLPNPSARCRHADDPKRVSRVCPPPLAFIAERGRQPKMYPSRPTPRRPVRRQAQRQIRWALPRGIRMDVGELVNPLAGHRLHRPPPSCFHIA
jgi:hypothetical protein